MHINELLSESDKIEEISLGGLAKGVGKAAKGLGAVAGGVHGAWDAARAGYNVGRTAVAGNIPGTGIEVPSEPSVAPSTTPTGAASKDLLKKQIQAAYQQGLKHGKMQANQPTAAQQMDKTRRANAQAAQADAALVAAVKAAKAKPAFQQTAQDKLTIKKGAEKGIHESVFRSKFLDLDI